MSGLAYPCLSHMKFFKRWRFIHRDTHKEVNGDKIQSMGTSRSCIFCQVAFLGVSDQCDKKPNV